MDTATSLSFDLKNFTVTVSGNEAIIIVLAFIAVCGATFLVGRKRAWW